MNKPLKLNLQRPMQHWWLMFLEWLGDIVRILQLPIVRGCSCWIRAITIRGSMFEFTCLRNFPRKWREQLRLSHLRKRETWIQIRAWQHREHRELIFQFRHTWNSLHHGQWLMRMIVLLVLNIMIRFVRRKITKVPLIMISSSSDILSWPT